MISLNKRYKFCLGTFKNRLKETDKFIVSFLLQNKMHNITFLEVAGSNFITTFDLITKLKEKNIIAQL